LNVNGQFFLRRQAAAVWPDNTNGMRFIEKKQRLKARF
jgi:hypothetical protein